MSEYSTRPAAEADADQPDPIATLVWLRAALGDRLLSYVLGSGEEQLETLLSGAASLSEHQASVLTEFHRVRSQLPAQLVEGVTVDTVVQAWTLQVQEDGRTLARALRAQSGVADDFPSGENDLERTFAQLAADAYPALLLPEPADVRLFSRDFPIHVTRLLFAHPADKPFKEAALADPQLAKAFPHEREASGRYGFVYTNTGWASGFQLDMLPETILRVAWRRVKHEPVAPVAFVSEAFSTLEMMRSLFAGTVQPIQARFAFAGLLMPEGSEIKVRNGVVRPTTAAERELAPESLRQQLSTTDESGSQVFIGYDGDVVYDYKFPYKLRVSKRELDDPSLPFPDDMHPPQDFEHDSLLIRFSLMLAVERRDRVQLVATWRNYDDPLLPGISTSWNDSRQVASLMPAQLTEGEVAAWQEWYDRLNKPEVSRIELALSRILRALAERREPSDVLIDAVIAWENLFGHKEEATLRVTLSLARLIADTPKARADLRSELGKIYALRSNIVHGAANLKISDQPKCQRALEVAIEAMRVLVSQRSDILSLPTGAERSNALIVE